MHEDDDGQVTDMAHRPTGRRWRAGHHLDGIQYHGQASATAIGVIAESFSPGYWRGEISMGFPQVSCPGILGFVERWDEIEVDWTGGSSATHSGQSIAFEPLSLRRLPHARGRRPGPYLKQRLAA